MITDAQQRQHQRLQTDLRFFSKTCLKIKAKEGGEIPFVFNRAQEYLHERIERQLANTGMVRMFIIKGRQQGISTYIAARLYHKITRQRAKNVFILSHIATTTETLFQIVDRYHTNCPPPATPKCIINNNRRMKFENHSQYTVGTAGSGSIGRGDTNQFLHWSEVAFCENIPELLTGVVQTVADVPGTEKLYESTANGVGNFFYRGCMATIHTVSARDAGLDPDASTSVEMEEADGQLHQYELVFIPWYWQDEYRAKTRPDFELTEYEVQLQELYGVDNEQLQWRRNKIAEFDMDGSDGDKKFKQEYPFTVREAFQFSGSPLIDPDLVSQARKSKITDPNAPLIIGVDPARNGDRTVFTHRQGRHSSKVKIKTKMNEMLLAGMIANLIETDRPDKVFVDITGGCGNGAVDRLYELGYGDIVMGVKFSVKPDDDRYVNKRAEMAGLLKEWFEDQGGCRIPDQEDIEVELAMIPEFKVTSNGLLQLESKDKIKKDYGYSPDIFDSMMLTFAYPVRRREDGNGKAKRVSGWTRGTGLEANRNRNGYTRSSGVTSRRIR